MNYRRIVPSWFALMIVVAAVTVIVGAFNAQEFMKSSNGTSAPSIGLTDQVWMDKLPLNPQSTFNAYVFAKTNSLGTRGEFESAYKFNIELFEFNNKTADTLKFLFLHDDSQAVSSYIIEKVETPEHFFDTRLTIMKDPRHNNEKGIYYSCPELHVEKFQQLDMKNIYDMVKMASSDKL